MTVLNHLKTMISLYLTLIAFLILGTRTATFLHEVLGHALTAIITGGNVYKIKVSMFGGGRVWADLAATTTPVLVMFSLSGIFINLVTGSVSFLMARNMKSLSFQTRLFLTVFAMASILGALAYLTTGIYYEFGDPVTWTSEVPDWYGLLWLPLTGIVPAAAFFPARYYAELQEHLFHASGFITRSVYAALTLGIALITYLTLFIFTQQNLASATASDAAFNRETARILLLKKETLFKEIQKQHPELSASEIQAIVDKTKIHIKPEEVQKKFPILPVIIGLCFLGGLAALIKTPEKTGMDWKRPGFRRVVIYCLAASAVVFILAYTEEFIYIA